MFIFIFIYSENRDLICHEERKYGAKRVHPTIRVICNLRLIYTLLVLSGKRAEIKDNTSDIICLSHYSSKGAYAGCMYYRAESANFFSLNHGISEHEVIG